MTNAKLIRALASALRAAAQELEREAAAAARERPRAATSLEISELDQARADKILAKLGML